MVKFLERFRNGANIADKKINSIAQQQRNRPRQFHNGKIVEQRRNPIGSGIYDKGEERINKNINNEQEDDYYDYDNNNFDDNYEPNIQIAQKSESFHHFILDPKYEANEKSIRGYKDVFSKSANKWELKRKEIHCFTDEEAESIVRMAQVHLGTDIKLARMSLEAFGSLMDLLWDEFERFFRRIMEYRYGRYGSVQNQSKMKDEAVKILVELYNSVWANYSRAIGGRENDLTHDSVKSQESLQGGREEDYANNTRGFQ